MTATTLDAEFFDSLTETLRKIWPRHTAKEAAQVAGISPRSVECWLQRRASPSAKTLYRMARRHPGFQTEMVRHLMPAQHAAFQARMVRLLLEEMDEGMAVAALACVRVGASDPASDPPPGVDRAGEPGQPQDARPRARAVR